MVSKETKKTVGITMGTVIFLCSVKLPAPSNFAASKRDGSMEVKAAVRRTTHIPVFFHMKRR